MHIKPIDPQDEHAFGGWFTVMDTSLRDARPGDSPPNPREVREAALDLVRPGTARDGHLLLTECDGVPVGAARLALPVRDNTATAELQLHVLPRHRRQGIGSALLAEAGRLAAAAHRIQLFTEIDEPESTNQEPGDWPGFRVAPRVSSGSGGDTA